jgi:predicted metalloprotease
MKWQGRRQSGNVEDRRGMSGGKKVALGGGAIGIIFLLLQMFLGDDNANLLQEVQQQLEKQNYVSNSCRTAKITKGFKSGDIRQGDTFAELVN